MAKKSIGQFIAALRKANGMTQKQLAEKLSVSDKAISRWERDECFPDLSLIPAISEIFGVTSDEILRGEKIPQSNAEFDLQGNIKTEKQIERLANDTRTKFVVRSIISVAISILGLFAAMICNFGFLRAYIGFFLGCCLYLISVICETIFIYLAYSSINSSDLDCEKVKICRAKMFHVCVLTYAIVITIFAMSLPLVIIPGDTYMGITFVAWTEVGLLCGLVAIVISILLILAAKKIAIKRGLYTPSKLNHLQKRYIATLLIILGVTLCGQIILYFSKIYLTFIFSILVYILEFISITMVYRLKKKKLKK